MRAEVNTLQKVFNNVYIIPCNNPDDPSIAQNVMVIATEDDLKLDGTYDLQIDENEIIITDDYCPIDSLIMNMVD